MTIDPFDPRLNAYALSWAEVDPAVHPFEAGTVQAVVRAMAPAEVPPPYAPMAPVDRTSPDPHDTWVDAVTLARHVAALAEQTRRHAESVR